MSSDREAEAGREDALARLAGLMALDTEEVADGCGTRLVEPVGRARATLVMWHGLANCPAEFADVASVIAQSGVRVLLPRMPYHGYRDTMTWDLAELTREELVAHVDECMSVAAAYGEPVWTAGLSAGAVLATWAAVTRSDVTRVALASPFVAPKATPLPLVRLIANHPRVLPRLYFWWNPLKKERLRTTPGVYPGFPLPAIAPILQLAQQLHRGMPTANHTLQRVVLIENPGDFAIRRDAARTFTRTVFKAHSDCFAEVRLDGGLGWWHDFIDPKGLRPGPTGQVAAVFMSALGIGDDLTGDGAFTTPCPAFDHSDTSGVLPR